MSLENWVYQEHETSQHITSIGCVGRVTSEDRRHFVET